MKRIKIFHSMPLAGRTPAQIEFSRKAQHEDAIRATAEQFAVNARDCVILDTFIKDGVPENANALWYMGEGIRTYLSQADVLCLAADWETARGCRIEKAVAEAYNVPVIILGV